MGDFLVECQCLSFRSKHESNGTSLSHQLISYLDGVIAYIGLPSVKERFILIVFNLLG